MCGSGRLKQDEVGVCVCVRVGGDNARADCVLQLRKEQPQKRSIPFCRPSVRFLFKALKKTTYGALISDRVIGLINIILNTTLMFSIQFFLQASQESVRLS